MRNGDERGKTRLTRILGGIKNNVGPVADGISVLKEGHSAVMTYGPALMMAVDAALRLFG